jgi:HlyD family secretion protein
MMLMKSLVRKFVWLLVGLGVVGLIVYAFLPKPVGVDLGHVTRGSLRVTVDEAGKTRIRERYLVSAPLAGRLQRIPWRAGDRVEAGKTVLAVVEPADPALLDARAHAEAKARVKAAQESKKRADSNLERARAAEIFARSEFARTRRMRESSSRHELEDAAFKERAAIEDTRSADFALRIAEFELEQAEAAFRRTWPTSPGEADSSRFEIRSPINGRILLVDQESAAVVTPGQKLIEVGDATDLQVQVDVLSRDAVKVRPGMTVLCEHWGGGEPLRAHVRLVEPAAFTKTSALGVEEQRVYVIAEFDDPPEKRPTLGDAYRVEARIVIWEGHDVLKVPAGGHFRHGDGWAVYVAEGGKAVLRPVKLGRSNGLETEVLEGLSADEVLIVHPGDSVKDGVAITPR